MKRFYVGIMTVLFIALTTTVFALGPKGSGVVPAGFGRGPYGYVANLNLSDEQTDKMWLSKDKFRNDTQKLRYEMFKKRNELRKLYADPNTSEATLLAKQKELNALRQNMQDKAAQYRIEQRKILTPEQLKKLSETGYGPGFGGRKGFGAGGSGRYCGF